MYRNYTKQGLQRIQYMHVYTVCHRPCFVGLLHGDALAAAGPQLADDMYIVLTLCCCVIFKLNIEL